MKSALITLFFVVSIPLLENTGTFIALFLLVIGVYIIETIIKMYETEDVFFLNPSILRSIFFVGGLFVSYFMASFLETSFGFNIDDNTLIYTISFFINILINGVSKEKQQEKRQKAEERFKILNSKKNENDQ